MIELGDYLGSKGVENIIGGNKGGTLSAEGISVTLTHAFHSSSYGEEDGTIVYTGEPAGLIITLENGYRIYFAGDTTVFGDMALIGELYKPDLAMLPIGDFFTMGPMEAAKAVELLGVKRVLGMHYGTFPILTGTPQGLRDELAKRGLTEVVVEELQPGDTLS
jgi:L-ascorbate metabolism protein UlaG (beta-lactamase superfamily)